jgi:hypothetical protein
MVLAHLRRVFLAGFLQRVSTTQVFVSIISDIVDLIFASVGAAEGSALPPTLLTIHAHEPIFRVAGLDFRMNGTPTAALWTRMRWFGFL